MYFEKSIFYCINSFSWKSKNNSYLVVITNLQVDDDSSHKSWDMELYHLCKLKAWLSVLASDLLVSDQYQNLNYGTPIICMQLPQGAIYCDLKTLQ